MAIRIFDVDPDAKPRPKFVDDIVGRFRSGAQDDAGNPMSLEEWRVTTGDPEVADRVIELMGSEDDGPSEWVTKGEDKLEVYTTSKSVEIILDGPKSVSTRMALWGRNGKPIHVCDGEVTTDGDPCNMAGKTVAERKDAAKAGYGCEPSISVYFRLAEDPEMGRFRFTSGSWTLAGEIEEAETALAGIDAPARATLTLELVEYTTKKGRDVRYTKPVVKVLGPAE